jgi:predicted  nucleic acid-binding Zn-ribbon protein
MRSFKLYRLQQIDSQLDQARARVKQIDVILGDNEAMRQAQQRSAAAAAQLEQERKALRKAEENVQAQRLKIEQTESTLYGGKVRNPKELQDMQNETISLKRYLSVLEDRQLDMMINVEEAEANAAAAAADLNQVQADVIQQNSGLTAEKSKLIKETEQLESERAASAATIPPEDLVLYEQLRRQRRGVAVAKVTDKACAACGSTLSTALLHAALSPSQLARCESCNRILYGG